MKLSISDDEINFWITNLYEIWSSEKEDEEVRILCKGTHALIRFLQCGWYKYKNGLKNLEEYMKKSEMDIQIFHLVRTQHISDEDIKNICCRLNEQQVNCKYDERFKTFDIAKLLIRFYYDAIQFHCPDIFEAAYCECNRITVDSTNQEKSRQES